MARQPRLNIAEGVYHVTQRGVEQRDIVVDDEDRQEWLRLLGRNATRCGWRVFAYALMTNHFHIFLRTPEPNLSEGMQAFESGYVSLFNRKLGRVGPLFQGRFGAVLVEQETHGRVLSRYVHLNPHAAGLTPHPAQYRWSSYRHYLDPNGAPPWLDWRTILAEISQREAAARIAYRRFIEEGITGPLANPLDDMREGWLLGSDSFVERYGEGVRHSKLQSVAGDGLENSEAVVRHGLKFGVPNPDVLTAAVCARFGVAVDVLLAKGRPNNWARDAAVWLHRELIGATLEQLAQRYAAKPTAISEIIRRTSRRMKEVSGFREAVESVQMTLTGWGELVE